MNLANRLTVLRMGLAFVMAALLTLHGVPFGKSLALVVFVVAALTDYWDGRLARRSQSVSSFGQLMDPLADKILVSAAFICFVALREGHWQLVPAWIATIIISREFLVTGLRLLAATQGKVIAAGRWGKHKTAWQLVVIVFIMTGLAVRQDVLPRVLSGEPLERAMLLYSHYFRMLSYSISVFAALVTVVSGVIFVRQHRDVFMNDI